MEQIQAFLTWYLAPWRRIGRKEFGVALTLATVPGLVLMLVGWGGSAGSWLGPLLQLGAGGNGVEGALANLSQMGTPAAASGLDATALLNNLCLLAVVPCCRMRLRDIGWFGKPELCLTVLMNVSVVEGLLQSLIGVDLLPYGMLWSILNFGGYVWLSMAKGREIPPVHARTQYDATAAQIKRMDNDDY